MVVMGLIDRGDEELHYSDHSHRWTGPTDSDPAIWASRVEAHLEQHRRGAAEHPRQSPRDRIPPPTSGTVPPPTR